MVCLPLGGAGAVGGGLVALHDAGVGPLPLAGHVPHLLHPNHSVLDEHKIPLWVLFFGVHPALSTPVGGQLVLYP